MKAHHRALPKARLRGHKNQSTGVLMSRLVCNSCRLEVDGIAFRTTCGHFYCPKCAKQTFQSSSQCSICGAHLTEKSVKEVTVGIPVFEDAFSSCLFQNVFQNSSWENVKVNMQAVQVQYQELLHFTTAQLILSSTQAKVQQCELEDVCRRQASQLETAQQRMTDLELQKEDLVSSYEQQLRDSHRALVEVQEAYKEKLRKCQAWEKAYNNIRSQLPGFSSHASLPGRPSLLEQDMMQRDDARVSMFGRESTIHPQTAVMATRNVTHHSLPQSAVAQSLVSRAELRGGPLPPSTHAMGPPLRAAPPNRAYQSLHQPLEGFLPSARESSWSHYSCQPELSPTLRTESTVAPDKRTIAPSVHALHQASNERSRSSFFDDN